MNADIRCILNEISKNNDRKAFNLFYDINYEQVFRYSYYFLKDNDAAREVVSDIFFSIWRSRKTLESIENVDAWLYIVSRNEANRYLANKAKHDKQFISLDRIDLQIRDKSAEAADYKLQLEEIEELLTKVIDGLPERCRTIFLMARNEGLKPKEIADILLITESTVRVQMKIAIEKIVEKVKPHFPNLMFSVLIFLLLYTPAHSY